MFNTKNAVITNTESNGNYMPAGINENVHLKEVNVNVSPTGLDFLEIVFENKDGQTVSMSEWQNKKGLYTKTDEDLQRADDRQFGRLIQIINCFYPTIEDVELNSFKEMITWVKNKLDPMIATQKELRLKAVFDKNNYVTVSKNGIFVEPMTVDKKDSQIKKFSRDNFERTIVADKETSDPLTGKSTPDTGKGADDLPF
nr:MAG TPA: hypothetical protein [Caudoviricetes sp.]